LPLAAAMQWASPALHPHCSSGCRNCRFGGDWLQYAYTRLPMFWSPALCKQLHGRSNIMHAHPCEVSARNVASLATHALAPPVQMSSFTSCYLVMLRCSTPALALPAGPCCSCEGCTQRAGGGGWPAGGGAGRGGAHGDEQGEGSCNAASTPSAAVLDKAPIYVLNICSACQQTSGRWAVTFDTEHNTCPQRLTAQHWLLITR
jgi:hypothetical protein